VLSIWPTLRSCAVAIASAAAWLSSGVTDRLPIGRSSATEL